VAHTRDFLQWAKFRQSNARFCGLS
jgi:hypothetical protein